MGFSGNGQLFQACEKAAFVGQLRGVIVVGMARFPVGQDDRLRAELANDCSQAQFVFSRGMHVGVTHTQGVAPAYAQELRSFGGFFGANLRRAARTHLARGQVENARLVAELSHF